MADFTHDVFLSFRGDTRGGFTDHLYHALKDHKSLKVFRDDSGLKPGDEIGTTLIEAIERSRMAIAVISPEYGSSTWCLSELVKIMELHKGRKQPVFPIFYHVEPADVRHQKNQFAKAMETHESRYGQDSDKIKGWRSALHEVCNLSGRHCADGMSEADLVKDIVKLVLEKLSTVGFVEEDGVGFVEEEDVVGFVNDFNVVVEELKEEDSQNNVVSIIGMGGSGKTALARKIYNSNEIKKLFPCRAWSHVSKDYNKKEVLLSLLECLISSTSEFKDPKVEAEDVAKKLRGCLRGKKFLIVLDDVWDPDVWDDLKKTFSKGENGSKILITSRNKMVANATSTRPPHHLPFLDAEESWRLFCKKVFFGEECPSYLEPLGRSIAERSGGFPLAIVTLAELDATKKRSEADWRVVKGDIHWKLAQEEKQKVLNVLKLSYDDLPPKLKPCFLLFGVYPEGTEISARELIRVWIAEEFIKKSNAGEVEPEDVGEQYLDELVDRSLVQVVSRRSDGGAKTCRVHGIIRELCISESKKEKSLKICTKLDLDALRSPDSCTRVSILASDGESGCDDRPLADFNESKPHALITSPRLYLLDKAKSYIPSAGTLQSLAVSTESKSDSPSNSGRSMHLLSMAKSYVPLIKPNETSGTRSLFFFEGDKFHQDTLRNCPLLLVLHFQERYFFDAKTLEQLKAMSSLRYLKLGKSIVHRAIPDCVWSLPCLETLHAKSWTAFISGEVLKLGRLRHVVARLSPAQPPKKKRGPYDINKPAALMPNLQTLTELALDSTFGADDVLRYNLDQFPNIRKLALWFYGDVDADQPLALDCLSKLRTLLIRSARLTSKEDSDHVSLDVLRRRKSFVVDRPTVPLEAIPFPSSITKITLKGIAGLDSNNMSGILGKIPNLKVLKLYYPTRGSASTLCCGAASGDFPQLLLLHLQEMDELEELVLEEGAMPRLTRLVVRHCLYLKKVSPRFESLGNLTWVRHPENDDGPALDYLETSC